LREQRVTDREHAAMHTVQPAARDAPAHGARGQAEFGELAPGNHAVLPEREVGEAAVEGVMRLS
jgi:hypothetical protein